MASLEDPAAAPKHDWLSVIEGGVALTLHVQPGAKKTGIAGVHAAALKIRLAAPPIEGRANEALLRFVAERLGVPRRNVALVRGESSRDKVLRVSGVDSRSARRLLAPQDR